MGSLISVNENYVLCKPCEYMNNSGQTLSRVLRELKIDISRVLLVYDELDIGVGRYKLTKRKERQVAHRGVRDIDTRYPLDSILKLKVGIAPLENQRLVIKEFVMQDFLEEELEKISKIEGEIFKIFERFISLSDEELEDPINYIKR
ncbi:peptidyl-tRNA hydrolase [Candidatus Mycoplasma haematolamae str. Purdue]|uniref:Peptidyl-tRNA hydrolase n=1 Tax=Mycoplasma haematolamae (strain Purdue) TaxID=1212765 RepID=I7C5D6_MYCHA|nr:peptidyl-tRNA hydrolase [Candidatus Mycoplasma haematolamae str. Purdue]